jgi:Holliday junction DNA helicase RuvB
LRRVRDYAHVKGCEVIDAAMAASGLDMMDVDANGLDQMDRKILTCIISHFSGGPVGVKTIAVACSEEVRTIEEIYEPYLIQSGLLKRTPRGRVVTKKAYTHLGLPFV